VAATGAQTGHQLGRYRLIAELGHGGMADVFLAVAQGPAGFNKLLVVKQLRPSLAEDPEFLTMFLDEARLAARLSHRNVVQTYEVGIDGGAYFIAMEYLDGQSLKRIVHRARPAGIPLAMHVRILSETLAGLHHAHELRDFDGSPLAVVHRDVSPHNVFVTYAGEVKVVDFGIAKALDSSAETGAGVMKGKLAYMSPEQARSERVDRRADLFSVGVLLWEAIARRRMWEGMSSAAIVKRLLSADLPRLRDVAPDVPSDLDQICTRALAHAPEDRFASALEFQQALDAWLATQGTPPTYDQIGAFVGSLFAEDRKLLQAVVEKQIASVNAMSTGAFQAVSLPEIERSLSGSVTPSGHNDSDGSSRRVQPPLLRITNGGSSPGLAVQEAPSAVPGFFSRSRWPIVAALGALCGVVALVAVLGFGGRHPNGAAALPGASVPPATSTVPAPPDFDRVNLRIDVRPLEATVFLDDQPLPANPHTVQVDRGSKHVVRAEAPGFIAVTREVAATESTTLDLTLDRVASRPAPIAPATDDLGYVQPRKTGTPSPKRPLDSKDPWAD
jgi:serine/threonine protein kinase